MPRLTRAESQARTRELLVDTARELFMTDGYNATSIAKVADAAGFSSGAVYSNFDSKAELALAVLKALQSEMLGKAGEILLGDADLDAKLTALEHWADEAMDSGWPRLELEFALEARQEPALVKALVERERSVADLIAVAVEGHLTRVGLAEVVPARPLARAAISFGIGLAIQHLIDPNVSAKGMTDLLRGLLSLS